MRGLFIKINPLKSDKLTEERLKEVISLMNEYDQIIIDFENNEVSEIFEILRQINYVNAKATLLVHLNKEKCPEGYDEISV